jgi:hypothetical protein
MTGARAAAARWLLPLVLLLPSGRAPSGSQPPIIPHSRWQQQVPLGIPADAVRRNLKAGESLTFRTLQLQVTETRVEERRGSMVDVVRLEVTAGDRRQTVDVREGAAFNALSYHIAVVAIYGPGELGAGLVSLEVATLQSLPPHVANSDTAGGSAMRLRIPHRITHVTLHHTGDAKPLLPSDDPAQRLRNLQMWGARERNWWDVPYHFLLDLEGRVYEGRDWRFTGETNTTYDPSGHFLVSMMGNYDVQQPTAAQLEAIADMMAWAIRENGLTVDAIGGHYHYATTGCPGKFLRPYLEDGSLKQLVAARLARSAQR